MKSIIFILPYFGNFPNYFQLYLNSCKLNSTINWLLITDANLEKYNMPTNVLVKKTEFQNVQQIVKQKYGSVLEKPYDLCKYRVAYSELFKEATEYDFWGFCDCDLIWGDLRQFLNDEILSHYDKISWRGHMTLFRNSMEINKAYMAEIPGIKTFKGCIYGTDGINLFDEVGINRIFDALGYSIYKDIPFADLAIRSANFICLHDIFAPNTNSHQIFRWDSTSGLERIAINENTGEIVRNHVAYVHFLKRPMDCEYDKQFEKSFLVVPNKFIQDEELTINRIKQLSRKRIYWSYWFARLNFRFIFNKLMSIIHNKNNAPDIY